jgi:hypothetical protein
MARVKSAVAREGIPAEEEAASTNRARRLRKTFCDIELYICATKGSVPGYA